MFSAIISRFIILLCGVLYPAYASYKAVRTKSVKEYVKWMMYWIVFAFFTFAETLTDVFLSWFPFYYEIKVLLVIWLLSPVTKGSSVLYKKFVHPMLIRHEDDIEEYLNQAKEKGYSAVLHLGSKGVNYATNVIMQTAIKTFSVNPDVGQRALTSSQSDYDLQSNNDDVDNINLLPRSQSFNVACYNEFSGDEQLAIEPEEVGAARIRERPKRKTKDIKDKGAVITATKRNQKNPVRGRRRIHENNIEVETNQDIEIE